MKNIVYFDLETQKSFDKGGALPRRFHAVQQFRNPSQGAQ
jgi:hypothetical protein